VEQPLQTREIVSLNGRAVRLLGRRRRRSDRRVGSYTNSVWAPRMSQRLSRPPRPLAGAADSGQQSGLRLPPQREDGRSAVQVVKNLTK
jgi:hypothetical protein